MPFNRKEYLKKYRQREDVKQKRKEYNQREDVKQKRKEYDQREDVKKRNSQYSKKYSEARKEYNKNNKDKNRAYQRKWYKENKQQQIDRNNTAKSEKIKFYKDYKKNKVCQICGYDVAEALDFHHVNPSKKIKTVYKFVLHNNSLDKILNEINKCILICSNCHREIHAGLINDIKRE